MNSDSIVSGMKFQDFLEAAPDAMVLTSTAGAIVTVNRQFEAVFGYSRTEIKGTRVDLLVPPEFRARHAEHRGAYMSAPNVRAMHAGRELFALRKDGTHFPAEISLSPLPTDSGVFVLSAIRDISDRKEAQRVLQAKNAELEALNADLESFCYSISHDLRAPIRAMQGFAGYLRAAIETSEKQEAEMCLGRIQENAARMGELVDSLLRLSRFSKHALDRKPVVDPAQVARAALADLGEELRGRHVEIDFQQIPPCHADPVLLQQVYSNLLSNAVKFTRGRTPAHISVGALPDPGGPILFVRDNGVGFDLKYARKLFGVFQRLHSLDQFEGTGVGLAIVHKIIQRHGGRVWAEAAPNAGATFYFTLAPGL